jgi:MFS superfamily sulfate permease-like transporter
LFGGIPATGAIARTATNIRNGGRTPVAGMTHAVTLLLITLFFGRLAGLIPMATLGAILVIVAYNMSEWRTFRSELRGPKSDVVVLVTTFLLTVIIDLTVAIEVGMVLSAFLFMPRMAEVTNVTMITREFADGGDGDDREGRRPRSTAAEGRAAVRGERTTVLRRGGALPQRARRDQRQAARARRSDAPRSGDGLDGHPRAS